MEITDPINEPAWVSGDPRDDEGREADAALWSSQPPLECCCPDFCWVDHENA